ncbi:Isotrichodermin C-15 hydroxylase [Talaromyces pinophilus]|nr:Isotrichodermin C-15 hydroxylase [Talaromyces pinophilus]
MAIFELKWTSVVSYILTTTVIFTISKLVYNIFFHPLRHYPGPFLARATRLYHLYYDLSGVQHLKQKEWHDRYGEVVRIAPDELSYTSAQAWVDICGHRTRDRPGSFEKDPIFFGGTRRKTNIHIIVANDKDHRRLRRLQSHAFSEKALTAQQGVIKTHLDTFIAQLKKRAVPPPHNETSRDGIVDIVQWLNFLAFDTIGDLAFGSPIGCLLDPVNNTRYIQVIFSMIKVGNYFRAARRFPSPLKQLLMLAIVPKRLVEDRKYQVQVSKEKIDERMRRETERADFMSYILRGKDENAMTYPEYIGAAVIFLAAGSETTATLLSGALYLLLTHLESLEQLTAEIRTYFRSETDIDMHSTANLPFLQAVLQESLRLYPPAPNAFPRRTPAPGQVICGRFVPAKTAVGIHQWSANRSSRNFYLPDRFVPERWMGMDKRFDNDKRDACQPFSFGPRNCIGQNLAYAEMRMTMCRILWNFDLELQEESRNWLKEQKTFNLWEKDPLHIRLRTVAR